MGIPPPMMPPNSGNPPPNFFGGPPMRPGGPPPHHMMRPPPGHHHGGGGGGGGPNNKMIPSLMDEKPSDHPMPMMTPSGPPVTVFVGNITEKWPDAMIRQLLATCGQVINWKRVQGASGKLQGFGFCEFSGPDAGLRAVRLLHDLEVGDKKLVVKVDAKTSSVLEEYKGVFRYYFSSLVDYWVDSA
jgi:RNA-binding protein 25